LFLLFVNQSVNHLFFNFVYPKEKIELKITQRRQNIRTLSHTKAVAHSKQVPRVVDYINIKPWRCLIWKMIWFRV